jgi:hypothetical protein
VAARSGDQRTASVAAALTPCAWRDLTDRMLARQVLAAADRFRVVRLIHSVPGAAVGGQPLMEPAEDTDARIGALLPVLTGRRWRELSLDRLCADLLTALDAWEAAWDPPDADARGLPDER